MNWLIADGGGTKTKAWLVNAVTGQVVASAVAGPSNFGKVKAEGLTAVLHELLDSLTAYGTFNRAVLGLAGVGREAEHEQALSAIRTIWSSVDTTLVTDAELAYRGAFCDGRHGVLLIMGTGTIAFYRTQIDHEFARAGGWGPLLGDEGGGNWIGREIIRHCLREWEEDELSPLHGAVLEQLQLDTTPQLISKVYGEGYGPGQWAELAPLAFRFAHESPGAQRILNRAAIEYVELVERLVAQHLPEAHDVPLVIMGGLWEQHEILRPLIEQEISIRNLPLHITEPAGGIMEGGLAILRDKR